MDQGMPGPTDEHRRLHAMVGAWVGEETLYPSPWDPAGGPATGRISARLGIDGFFVISDYVEERGGREVFRGHGVYGWDRRRRAFTMYWFDSGGDGPAGPARGRFEGDTLTFERAGDDGAVSRYVYQFEADGRYTFTIRSSADGGATWKTFMEARYLRQG
jgi:hypothetical protein